MDLIAVLIAFIINALLFGGSLVISCAVGFSLFPASHRVRQLVVSGTVLIVLHLVSFKLVLLESPFWYSSLVLLACVGLALRLLDTTDSMVFSVIRTGLILLIGLLIILHSGFLIFMFAMWLISL